jgi:hypothetical protein
MYRVTVTITQFCNEVTVTRYYPTLVTAKLFSLMTLIAVSLIELLIVEATEDLFVILRGGGPASFLAP